MAARAIIFIALCFSVANSEHVIKKFCQNVEVSKCSIHNVELDPCPDGPGFCLIRRNKPYRLSFDFTPRFEAEKIKLSLLSDDDNSDSFSTVIMPPHNACVHQVCPVEEGLKTKFDIDFVFEKKKYGKFPIQLKLWNEADESEACCFTINVKMLK